ncbi:MAG: hypothetical protein AAF206_25275, partial [Bacteroidota bacterium]
MLLRCLLIGTLSLISCPRIIAQMVRMVVQAPAYTPDSSQLYLAGSFNGWNPAHPDYRFQQQANGDWVLEVEVHQDVEYKITRGNWESVEGSGTGKSIFNRSLKAGTSKVRIRVLSWEDLAAANTAVLGQIPVVVRVPDNTPHDARVYISGDFNDWDATDPAYLLRRDSNNVFRGEMTLIQDSFGFKFTRGNWESVEGRLNHRPRFNRVFDGGERIEANIEVWEDLHPGAINGFTLVLLLAALQSFFLVLFILRPDNFSKAPNRVLLLLLLLVAVALLSRVATFDRSIFDAQPKLLLLPDIIYFFYPPLFFFYFRSLLTQYHFSWKKIWLHFIPAALHLLSFIPILQLPDYAFITRTLDHTLMPYFGGLGMLAFLFNLYYWFRSLLILRNYNVEAEQSHSFEQNIRYLYTVLVLTAVCLAFWAGVFMIYFGGEVFEKETLAWVEKLIDATWLTLSLTTYCLAYFAINQGDEGQSPSIVVEFISPRTEKEDLVQRQRLILG